MHFLAIIFFGLAFIGIIIGISLLYKKRQRDTDISLMFQHNHPEKAEDEEETARKTREYLDYIDRMPPLQR